MLIECFVVDGRFEVRSVSEAGAFEEATTVHCSGSTAASSDVWQRCIEHALLRLHARAADVRALYDGFNAVGLQYGPGYRSLVSAWGGVSVASSRLRSRSTHEGTQVHPADLDDALCASGMMDTPIASDETRLPFAVDDAVLNGAACQLWAAVRYPFAALPLPPCQCLTTLGFGFGRLWCNEGRRRSQCASGLCLRGRRRSSTASGRERCVLRRYRTSSVVTSYHGSMCRMFFCRLGKSSKRLLSLIHI